MLIATLYMYIQDLMITDHHIMSVPVTVIGKTCIHVARWFMKYTVSNLTLAKGEVLHFCKEICGSRDILHMLDLVCLRQYISIIHIIWYMYLRMRAKP